MRRSSVSSSLSLPSQSSSTWTCTPAAARSASTRCKLFADLARPIDERLKGDGVLRGSEGGEHRGKNFVTVEKRLDAVSADERRTEQVRHRPLERGIVDWRGRDVVVVLLLGRCEVLPEKDDEQDARSWRRWWRM